MKHIALVDDDDTLVRTLSRRLSQQGYRVTGVTAACSAEDLIELAADIYVLDLRFGQQSGLQFVTPLRNQRPDCRILVMTGFASITTAVQAVKAGADDYLTKPVDFTILLHSIDPSTASSAQLNDETESAIPELLSPEQLEWEHIQRILHEQQGNISQTARLLGMHRRTLQRKLSKHRP